MICPLCEKGEFIVVRTVTERSVVIRYRACNNPACGYRAKTSEDAGEDAAIDSSIRKPEPKEY